jgi:hypothetical protein
MRVLFIGDIVGRPGRRALAARLKSLRQMHRIDIAVANGENMADGAGVTRKTFAEVIDAGVDVVTGGNHSWAKREVLTFADEEPRLLRPANYPPSEAVRGRGSGVFDLPDGRRLGVMNLSGRVFLSELENPFLMAHEMAAELRRSTPAILVDFHAEATSEKVAIGWHLDGHVSAVVGTHTHVQTADERILPKGTAHITDVGMTGPHDGVIGVDREIILHRFLTQMPVRHEIAQGDVRINAVVIDIDDETGLARSIERISDAVDL